ncbi:diguanylate cyclase [Metallosphaera tengchongensis]|uniref:Diguanylate cyclase n=1 Tax=Metallosphaera tengchongensis TaxID=1532350 RepID=A0A6N0NXB0_9CREN|nr:NifB/NifX family molybdenum-iron cluster-binding protein [Metallosphaera tengchongensis]QKR00877.1 diguanylate cyclase [Metallosphaera tengchongensis]
MKVAVPVTNGLVDGPGEGEKVRIYEVEGMEAKLVEEYDNPALTANYARGVHMLKSALERGAKTFILVEIGPPGIRFLQGKAKVFLAEPNTSAEEAVRMLVEGKLKETDKPTHGEHHHH